MSFNLRVKFSGICTFVPNRPLDQGPTRMCILLPDADSDSIYIREGAADGKDLQRHRGFIRFNLRNLEGMQELPQQDDLSGLWYLGRRQLQFDFEGGYPESSTRI